MRDVDKPYVCIRHGWIVQITPRSGAGWRGLGLWLLLLALPTAGFVALSGAEPASDMMIVWTIAFLVIVAGWAIAMIRWMIARSEIVDLKGLEDFKRAPQVQARRLSHLIISRGLTLVL